MGTVVGPLSWKAKDRLSSWFLLRELREDIKWMKTENPVKFKIAIDKELTAVKEEFNKYVNSN